jgi:hypothetical protein
MTFEDCRALQRLGDVPRGIAKTLMLAYGFTDALIASLVLNGLATVATDIARFGNQTIEMELVHDHRRRSKGNFESNAGRKAFRG